MKIIDVHNHPDWHGHDLTKYLENMDRYGISVTWIQNWEAPADEYDPSYNSVIPETGAGGPLPFSRCLSYAERAPDRFLLCYCPDIRKPDAIDKMKMAVSVYGARVCGELKLRMMYDNPDAIRFFRYCGESGLPVTLHIDYEFETGRGAYPRPNYWYGGGFAAFERAVRLCPETKFLGHAPGFWAHISGDDQFDKTPYPSGPVAPGGDLVRMMRECDNLCCDLSAFSGRNALSRDPGHAINFLTEFSDRCLYGRDCFDNELQEFLNTLGLGSEILEKIYHKNAERLTGLEMEGE